MVECKKQISYVFDNFELKRWLLNANSRRHKMLKKLKDDLRRLQLSRRAMRRALLQLTRKPYVILDKRLVDSCCGNTHLPSNKGRKPHKHRDDEIEKNLWLKSSQDTLQQINEQIADGKAKSDTSAIAKTASLVIRSDGTAYQTKIQGRNLSELSVTPQNSVQKAKKKGVHIDNTNISIKDKDISLNRSSIRKLDFPLSQNKSLRKHAQKFVYESENDISESKTALSKNKSISAKEINIPVNEKRFSLVSISLGTISNLSNVCHSDSKISADSSKNDTVCVKEEKQKEKKQKEKIEIKELFALFYSKMKSSDMSMHTSKLNTRLKTPATENQDVPIFKKNANTFPHVDSKLLAEQVDTPLVNIPVKINMNKTEAYLKSTSGQEDNVTIKMQSKATVKRKMHADESVLPRKIQKNNEATNSPNKHLTASNIEICDYDTLSEDEQIYENNQSERREQIIKYMTKKKDMYKLLKIKNDKRRRRRNKKIRKIRQRFNDWFGNSMSSSVGERKEEHAILSKSLKKKEQQSMKNIFHDITTDEEVEDICEEALTNKHEASINTSQENEESSTKVQEGIKDSLTVIDTKSITCDIYTKRSEDIVSSTTKMQMDENMNKDTLCKNTEEKQYVVSAETEEINKQDVVQNSQEDQGCNVEKFDLINDDMKTEEDITANVELSPSKQESISSDIEEKGCDDKNVPLRLTDNDSDDTNSDNTENVGIEMLNHASITAPQSEKESSKDTCAVHEVPFIPIIETPISSKESTTSDNRSSENRLTNDDNLDDIEVEIKIKPKSKSRIYQKFSLKAPWSAVNSCIENLSKLKDNPNCLGELFQINYRKPSESSGYKNTINNAKSNTLERSLNVNQNVTTNSIETVSNTQPVVCNSSHITKDDTNRSPQQQNCQDDVTLRGTKDRIVILSDTRDRIAILSDNRDKIEPDREKNDERIQSVEQEKKRITVENCFASTCDVYNLKRQSPKKLDNEEKAKERQQNSPDVTALNENRNVPERNQETNDERIQSVEQEKTRIAAENSFASICDTSNLGERLVKTLSDGKEKADERQQQNPLDVTALNENKNVPKCNQETNDERIQSIEQEKTRIAAENSFASMCDTSNLGERSVKTLSDGKEKADERQQNSPDVTALNENRNVPECNQETNDERIQSVEQEKMQTAAKNSFASMCDTSNLGERSVKTLSDGKEKADERQQRNPSDIIILTEDTNITERNQSRVVSHNQSDKTARISQPVELKKRTTKKSSESARSACVAPDLKKQLSNTSAETSNMTHSKVRVRSIAELESWSHSLSSINPNISATSNNPIPTAPPSKPPSSYDTANKSLHTEKVQCTTTENIPSSIRNDIANLIQTTATNLWTNVISCRNIFRQQFNIPNVYQMWTNLIEIQLNLYNLKIYLQKDDNYVINYVNQQLIINEPITAVEINNYANIVNHHGVYLEKFINYLNTTDVLLTWKGDNAPHRPISSAPNINAQSFPESATRASFSGIRMPNPGNLQASATSYPGATGPDVNQQQFSENTVNFSRVSQSRQPTSNIHQGTYNAPSTVHLTPTSNANQQQSFVNVGNILRTSGAQTSSTNMSANGSVNQGNANAPPMSNKGYLYTMLKYKTNNTATTSVTSVQQDSQTFSQMSSQVNSRTSKSVEMTNRHKQQQIEQTTALNKSSAIKPNILRTGASMGNVRSESSSMNLQTQGLQTPPTRMLSLPQYVPNFITFQPNICARAQNIPLNPNLQQQNSRQNQHKDMFKRSNKISSKRYNVSNKISSTKPQDERQETSGAHNVSQDSLNTAVKISTSQKPNISQSPAMPNAPSQGFRSVLFSANARPSRSNEITNCNFNLQILTDIQKIILRNQLHLYFCMNEYRTIHVLKQQEFEELQYEKRILYSFLESLHNFIYNLQTAQNSVKTKPQNHVSQNTPVQENKIQSSTDKIAKTISDQSNINNSCDKISEKQSLKKGDSNISNIPTNSKSLVENNLSIEMQDKESLVTPTTMIIEKSSRGIVELQQTRDTPKMRFKKYISTNMGKKSEKSLPKRPNAPKENMFTEVFRKNSKMEAQDKAKVNKTAKSLEGELQNQQLPELCSSFVQNTSHLSQDISTSKITAKDQSKLVDDNVNTQRSDNAMTKNVCNISNIVICNSDKNDTVTQFTHNTEDQRKEVHSNQIYDGNDKIFSQNSQDGMSNNVKENIEKSKTDFVEAQTCHLSCIRTSTPLMSSNTSELISLIKECQSMETLQECTTCIDKCKDILPELISNTEQKDSMTKETSISEDGTLESPGRLYIDESIDKSYSNLQQQEQNKVSEENTSRDSSQLLHVVRCESVETSKPSLLKDEEVHLTDTYQSLAIEAQEARRLNAPLLIKSKKTTLDTVHDGTSENSERLCIDKSVKASPLNSQQEQRDKVSSSEKDKLDKSRDLPKSSDAVRREAIEIISPSFSENNEVDLIDIYQNLVTEAQDAETFNELLPIKPEETISEFCLNTQPEDRTNEKINNSEELDDEMSENSGRLHVGESASRSLQQEYLDKVSIFERDTMNTSLDISWSSDMIKCESIGMTSLSSLLEESGMDLTYICQTLDKLKSELNAEEMQAQKILPFEVPEDASNIGESTMQPIDIVKQSEGTEEKNINIDTHSGIKAINEGLKHMSEQRYTKSQISSCMPKNNLIDAKIKEDAENDILKDNIDECSSVKSNNFDMIIVPHITNVRSISPSLFEKIDNIDSLPQDNLKTLNEKKETKSFNVRDNTELYEDTENKPCLRCKRKSTVYCQGCLEAHYCGKRCFFLHWNTEHYKQCNNHYNLVADM